jgi:hypothetical protein
VLDFDRFAPRTGSTAGDKMQWNEVIIELQNLGDAQLCRDITAHLEHTFSGRQGDWRVSIAGSRASENWDLRVDGPNGFERSYTLSAAAAEHEPAAIRALVLRLLPSAKT